MPYPSLLHPEPLSLRQSTADRTFTGDAQTQFCLSLCGIPGSWCTQGLFEPSERLWQKWGLILNANSPLLPSCWAFSFAPGHGLSPYSCSRAPCCRPFCLIESNLFIFTLLLLPEETIQNKYCYDLR